MAPGSLRGGRGRGNREPAGIFAGFFVTVLMHTVVVGAAVRLGSNEGNVAAAARRPPVQSVPIETQLLKRGGGDFDPRRVLRRQAPVLAERAAPQLAVVRDPTRVVLAPDAGAQDYMRAITGRNRAGRDNPDLAERLRAMAAQEQATDPTAPPGPGSPTGSDQGTSTDPNAARDGAASRVTSFLNARIRQSSALAAGERRPVFRIRINDQGQIVSAELVQRSGNESLDADVLGQAQSLVESHAQVPGLSPEELAVASSNTFTVRIRED